MPAQARCLATSTSIPSARNVDIASRTPPYKKLLGRLSEVRRVLAFLGLQVSRLIRTSYGPFTIEDLEPGQVGEVQREELFRFRRTLA